MDRGLRKGALALATIAVASLVAVGATGFWLSRAYRPRRVHVSPDHFRTEAGGGWLHDLHVWSAIVLLVATVALLALLVVALVKRSPRVRPTAIAGSVGLVLAVVLGLVSGRDLRWSQLALWAVTADTDGVWTPAFNRSVRFFIVPGHGEVESEQYRAWVLSHMVAVPLLLAAAALLTAVALRRSPQMSG